MKAVLGGAGYVGDGASLVGLSGGRRKEPASLRRYPECCCEVAIRVDELLLKSKNPDRVSTAGVLGLMFYSPLRSSA